MSDIQLFIILVAVFLITNFVLKLCWKGKAVRIYQRALKEHTSVNAECVKTWIMNKRNGNRLDDIHKGTYQYVVNGKTYKKDLDYVAGTVTFYYDKRNPKRAVTKAQVNSLDHAFARIVVSFIVAVVIMNLLRVSL